MEHKSRAKTTDCEFCKRLLWENIPNNQLMLTMCTIFRQQPEFHIKYAVFYKDEIRTSKYQYQMDTAILLAHTVNGTKYHKLFHLQNILNMAWYIIFCQLAGVEVLHYNMQCLIMFSTIHLMLYLFQMDPSNPQTSSFKLSEVLLNMIVSICKQ